MTQPEPKKQKQFAVQKMIPNMITLTAMGVGMTSIRFAIAGQWEKAVLAIVVAAFMDAFDGAAARLLKAQSKLGAELDSFSDFVCFGVAPAIVVYLWSLHELGNRGWFIALIFAMAVTLRLARFNIATEEHTPDNPLSKYFTGVPSPVGAGLAILPMIISFLIDKKGGDMDAALANALQHPYLTGLWLVIVGGLMISHIPTFSSKQLRLPVQMKFPLLVAFCVLIAGLINDPWPTLTLMGVVYLLGLPLGILHYKKKAAAFAKGEKDPEEEDGE